MTLEPVAGRSIRQVILLSLLVGFAGTLTAYAARDRGDPGMRPNPEEQLGITPDQQRKLKAISQQFGKDGDPHDQLRRLLESDPLDEAGLRAWMLARQRQFMSGLPRYVEQLAAVREVLTPDQRNRFSQIPPPGPNNRRPPGANDRRPPPPDRERPPDDDGPPPDGPPGDRPPPPPRGGPLGSALRPPFPPPPPFGRPEPGKEGQRMHTLVSAFFKTGDKAALLKGLQSFFTAAEIEKRIAAIKAMDPEERVRLGEPPGRRGPPPR